MKTKREQYSSQFLVMLLAGVVLILMVQVAKAQTPPLVAQSYTQNQQINGQTVQTGNVMAVQMKQRGLLQKLKEDTTLSYYQQFLGPTAGGPGGQTYNVFQSANSGREDQSGRAPYQSYHAMTLRHQITNDWGVGASLAASNGYAKPVSNKNGDVNDGSTQFYNARAWIYLPAWQTKAGTLFTSAAYEAPTSSISKNEGMQWAWVAAANFNFNLPSYKWSAGVMGQAYRMYYHKNIQPPPQFSDGSYGVPTPMQTLILSGGPFVNYRFNDKWQVGTLVMLDWDQRGVQTGHRQFNNNLPDRNRTTLTYFPTKFKQLASVGLFEQTLLKFRPSTTAFGAEFMLRF